MVSNIHTAQRPCIAYRRLVENEFRMNLPTVALCNFVADTEALGKLALLHGFTGVDWTLRVEDLPRNQIEESRLLKNISRLNGLEIRYHCAFKESGSR